MKNSNAFSFHTSTYHPTNKKLRSHCTSKLRRAHTDGDTHDTKQHHINAQFIERILWLGVINTPLMILNTPTAVYIGIVYTYLPFMVLPIYSILEKLDESLLEAAEDLGCSRLVAFWLVTVPLAKNGIIAGCFLVFIPALGEFVIPSLLGGSKTLMIGKILWEEFFSNRDWPVASAVAIVLLVILIIPILLFQRNQQNQREADT